MKLEIKRLFFQRRYTFSGWVWWNCYLMVGIFWHPATMSGKIVQMGLLFIVIGVAVFKEIYYSDKYF